MSGPSRAERNAGIVLVTATDDVDLV